MPMEAAEGVWHSVCVQQPPGWLPPALGPHVPTRHLPLGPPGFPLDEAPESRMERPHPPDAGKCLVRAGA